MKTLRVRHEHRRLRRNLFSLSEEPDPSHCKPSIEQCSQRLTKDVAQIGAAGLETGHDRVLRFNAFGPDAAGHGLPQAVPAPAHHAQDPEAAAA